VVARVLPVRARRALHHRWGTRGAGADLVSIVVVVESADLPRLDRAVASVLEQSHSFLEVLVCPVDEAGEGLEHRVAALADGRVRLRADRPTLASAATAGAHAAHGTFLGFLRGCDLLPPGAIARGVATLGGSGSALSSGPLEQLGQPEPWLDRAQRDLHARATAGLEPARQPALAGDLTIGGKLVRRSVWDARPRSFASDDDWLLSPTMAALLTSVERVDVLDETTYTYLPDHGTRAFGATPSTLPGLRTWGRRTGSVTAMFAGTPLAAGWDQHVAGVELPRLLQDAERATPAEWDELRSLAAAYDDRPDVVAKIRAAPRAMLWLAARDRRRDLEALAAEVAASGDDLPTRLEGARVLAGWRAPGLDLPDDVRRLTEAETALRAHVQRVRWTGDERVAEILVEVRHVDLGAAPPAIKAWTADGAELEVQHLPPDEATRWAGRRFQRAAAFAVRVPGHGAATLTVDVRVGELVRSGTVSLPPRTAAAPVGAVVVTDLLLDGTTLVVRGTGELDALRLLDPRGRRLEVAVDRSEPGTARIELRTDLFGAPTWLASGGHRLVTEQGNVSVTEELRGRLPLALVGERHRVRPHLGPRGGLVLGLGAPLADEELGPFAQEQLRAGYAAATSPVEPDLFYFESYAGRTATDSPHAIFEELRRRRPDLTAYWGIADHSQRAPEGAVPVLLRSRAWYDVLARAGCLVLNTDVDVWFRRRPGQFLLQTFHGYPSKAMGLGQWQAMDYGPARIREFRARGVDSWSAILTPSPAMTHHYREQYSYDGPAIEHGYPRDDDLVGPEAGPRREATRRLLGIGAGQKAVLYAPTWRDHLATRPRAAAMSDFVDVRAAAEALGDDWVLLRRGHRFHAPEHAGSRVVDVTAYPEINDLILASDAAVLDYSSLRFDYALTGRPMVFLVPDLEDYDTGSRSFLFPFADSAPGPFVRDTEGAVAELRDLDGLRARQAREIADFNATYNRWHDGQATGRVVDALLALL
jgi:CDP-glycerol glycerophosphotransferase (TagB/SpsB family)